MLIEKKDNDKIKSRSKRRAPVVRVVQHITRLKKLYNADGKALKYIALILSARVTFATNVDTCTLTRSHIAYLYLELLWK